MGNDAWRSNGSVEDAGSIKDKRTLNEEAALHNTTWTCRIRSKTWVRHLSRLFSSATRGARKNVLD